MSTQRPQPELSAYFIREKRILKAADTAKYNARLKEIDLPDDYAIYGYEPSSGRKPAAYWVCKQGVGECPECHKPYLEDAIASVSESKLTHYCRVEIPHEGRKPTYEIHPATLYLRRIRWLCYKCYSEHKTYNARMQDDSKLVDKEDKKLTLQVKEHLGQQAMHMEINTLAEIFDISPHTVDKCFDKAVDKYDKERDWDNISTLGLYTITLNVQGQQADCCLCANVDTEKLIEFFPYEDTKAAEAFLSKLKNKQNIQRVFTSIDSAAFDFAKTNFPIEIIMVDRLDVRKRLLNGLETVKKGNDDSKNYPLLRRNWTLLDNDDEAIPTNSKDYILLKKVLDAFPRIGVAYWLKEAGMDIYRKLAGQCKLVNDWILSDKHNILPYEQLQQCMTQAKEPVVRFAEQYNGVDRSRYEKAILAAEKPLMNCAKSNEKSKSARWSRAASFKKIRARVLYGAAMMANYFAAQEPNEKSHEEYAIHKENQIVYDSVLVITDRVVVDRQLQDAIKGIDHKSGLVCTIDDKKTSADLADALKGNYKIIVTTIQKFLYVDFWKLAQNQNNKTFAIIIDEAHSSTSGKDMIAVKNTLGQNDGPEEADAQDAIENEIQRHGKAPNVSVFAFTATPKPMTLRLFGRESIDADGNPVYQPFHLYSMKQAIEEGYILDVLQNYIEYKTYYKLNKTIEDDPEMKTIAAKRQIARYIDLFDDNINQRVNIIVEHFRSTVMQELGGQAKAILSRRTLGFSV